MPGDLPGRLAARSPTMPPWAIYPLSPALCARLITDYAMYFVTMSSEPLLAALDDVGMAAEWILSRDQESVQLVGLYGPTNGMTAESSHRRREFQSRFLDYLAEINNSTLCVVGDLNVVEPNHRPHLPAFEDHDYAFYTDLLALGLRDAYRELNPAGGDHSWLNPRFGNQRLDHSLVSTGTGDIQACAYDHTTRSDDLSDHAALLTTIGLRADTAATNGHDTW
ncbi:MAG: hypothetical protein ACT4NY_25175 [Pseudonocardiales bacterium]